MATNKVIKYGLEELFMKHVIPCNFNWSKVARRLNHYLESTPDKGVTISWKTCKAYYGLLSDKTKKVLSPTEDICSNNKKTSYEEPSVEAQTKYLEDRETVASAYDLLLNKIYSVLDNAETDEEIRKAAESCLNILKPALTHHNIGVVSKDINIDVDINIEREKTVFVGLVKQYLLPYAPEKAVEGFMNEISSFECDKQGIEEGTR